MKFNVKGQEERLRFGVKFIRLMDKKYTTDIQGVEFGTGVIHGEMGLAQRNVAILSDIIHCALGESYHEDDIDSAVDDYAESGDLKKLFEQVEKELGKSQAVQVALDAIEENQPKEL